MHLGNLMGAVLPFGRTAVGNDAAIFIADLHSLTSVKDGKTLREQTLEVAIEYLAIYGVDTPITIFRQSDIHQITQLMWILSNVTPFSLMLRAHSFKETEQRKFERMDEIQNKIKILVSHKNYYKELKENKPDSGLHLFESFMLKFYESIDSIDDEIRELNILVNSNEISLNM